MFKNPGKKIKIMAIVILWTVTVISVIMAFVLGIKTETHYDSWLREEIKETTIVPALFWPLLIGSPALAFVSSLCLYGFGELIENSAEQNEQLREIRKACRALSASADHSEAASKKESGREKTPNAAPRKDDPVPAVKPKAAETPEGPKTIDAEAFKGNSEMKFYNIPDGVVSIGNNAFAGCTDLESIRIPGSVETVGDGAFNDCDNLKTVIYRGSREKWAKISVAGGNEALNNAAIVCMPQ